MDPPEAQALRWKGLAGEAAIAGREDLGNPVGRGPAAADLEKGARDDPDHVVEESVAHDLQSDAGGPGGAHLAGVDRPDGVVTSVVLLGEARDVVVFSTTLRVGDHPDNVETIELWIDIATGLPVREARTYDFTLDTPLGDAGYTEAYEWSMTSLDPVE